MKYWLLTTEYPPDFGGGIGTYCHQWGHLLQQKGHEVSVFIPDPGIREFTIQHQTGIRVIRFSPYLGNTSAYLGYETTISYSFSCIVESFLRNEGIPDWIEAQEYNGIAYYVLLKKHLGYDLFKETRVLITCHCPSFITFQHNHVNTFQLPYFWIGEMERFSIKAADLCISPSQYLADYLQKQLALSREIIVLHNPFDVSKSHKKGSRVEDKVVFIGKLSPAKGVLPAIEGFKQLWEEGYTCKLVLVGDKNYYYHALQTMMGSFIQKKYAKYFKEGVLQLQGLLPPEKVKEEVETARVVVLPSTVENFPYAVLECMADEKIVLSSVQGGQREIMTDGENGFLFDHDEPGSFVKKLKQIFSLPDEELTEIGKKAAKTIADCCAPDSYYRNKTALLQSHDPSLVSVSFPFIHHFSVPAAQKQEPDETGLLSVVVPFYNMGRLLLETIDSIQASSYGRKEIIVVNDGSSDKESKEVLDLLRGKSGIRIIDQRNGGLAMARNAGAVHAHGEYLAFLDADDLVDKEYYAKAIKVLQGKPNVHFVGSWIRYFGGAAGVWPTFNPEPPFLLFHNMVNSSGLVYRKTSFLEAGINDKSFVYGMEDYDSVLNMVKKGLRGVVLPETLFHYRVRKNSMARAFNKENKTYLYQLLAEKHAEFYATFAAGITNLLNVNGPGYAIDNPTLDYHLFRGNSTYNKLTRKVLTIIKRQPHLRKIALSLKNKL